MQNLANVRRAKGISQKDLAARANVPAPNLCRYEKGRLTPLLPTALKIAAALGVSVEDLVNESKGNEHAA